MKILIAADLYWPTINGVATFSRNLALGMAARGHEVIVIAPSQRRSGLSGEEEDGNVQVKRTMSVPFPFYQNFRISLSPRREVKKIIEDFDPDVIHIQMLLGIGQACMKYGNRYNIPIVSTNHAIPENLMDNIRLLAPVSKPINYLIAEYGARFHAKADYITMPTEAAITMLTEGRDKLPTVPMVAVSNGIDLSKFTPTKAKVSIYKKFKIPADKTVITYLGRLDAEKHVSKLIEAFNDVLILADVPVHLLLVGFGTEEDRLKNQAYELGIDKRITFTGRVTDEEIVELQKVGDVFCMPSPAELQCISALEAMASGKPVVAVDAGAVYELCQNKRNGFLCEKDNVAEITLALKTLVEDPKLRKQFGKESLAIAKTHDIAHTLKSFEKIYQEVMAAKTHAVPQRLL
ncbi:glycosyltransferase [Candidatus Saccharibacteria bacterium]|nr:glycosyltransferase [Candidatus Saccharibacteria bacterium]